MDTDEIIRLLGMELLQRDLDLFLDVFVGSFQRL